jgi:CBS domain-containing protein
MRAKDVMTRPVVRVMPDTFVKQAAMLLTAHGFTTLPVVDEEDHLVGVVTESDVLRDRITPDSRTDGGASPSPPAMTVASVMSTQVDAASPGTHVATLTRLMLDRRVRAVPVVDDDGRLTGIVTRRDLLRTIARADDVIARDVRHHLSAAGRRPWQVSVSGGMVTLASEGADETDRHVATVVAAGLPGVVGVRVVKPEA